MVSTLPGLEMQALPKAGYFQPLELYQLKRLPIPHHVAFINDGNRRWAKRSSFKISEGHKHGADSLVDIVKSGKELGIKTMTFYGFSTENWNRPSEEVSALMFLFETYIRNLIPTMLENEMHFDTIGDLSRMPKGVNEAISEAKAATKELSSVEVIFAMNYGARDEICRAVKKMVNDGVLSEEITEEKMASYLDTKGYSDPDLLIRTGGEQRISNFLLWQLSYAEIYVTEVLWPDFSPKHLLEAVRDFQVRSRRYGQ